MNQTVRGFNAGYIIEKYVPKLSAMLRENLEKVDNEYAQAFVAGGKEMMQERNRSKIISKMRSDAKSLGKSKDRGKDMDIDR